MLNQQLAALNALASQISNARIAAQQAQTAQETAIQNALATLYGTGLVVPPVVTDGGTGVIVPPVVEPTSGGQKLTAVQQLAAIPIKASNTALQKRIDNFIATKPNASAAVVAKAFPELSKAIAKKNK